MADDDSNDDRAPSSPIALAPRGIPTRRRRVLPSRRDVRGQISNYQLFLSHMNNQHFPSRVRTRSVVKARRCLKKRRAHSRRPSTPIPRVDASTARVVVATTHCQMSNYYTVYPYKNKHTKMKPKSIQTSSNAAARTNGRTDVRRTEHTCSARRRRRRRRRRRVSSRLADASRTVGVVGVVGRASKRRCQSVLSGTDDGTRTRATRGRRRRGRRRGGPRRCRRRRREVLVDWTVVIAVSRWRRKRLR